MMYNPFGMQTANSWTRENTTGNNFLANGGTELNTTSNLYDLEYRNYDPVLGRMNQVDPMASKYASLTPYNFSFNDPVTFSDPNGADPASGGGAAFSREDYWTETSMQQRVAMRNYCSYQAVGNNSLGNLNRGGSPTSMFNSGWTPTSGSMSASAYTSGNQYFYAYNEEMKAQEEAEKKGFSYSNGVLTIYSTTSTSQADLLGSDEIKGRGWVNEYEININLILFQG